MNTTQKLAGKTKLRRIVRWGKRHLEELRRHMPFPNGVPSVSAMSRVLAAVDEEMVSLALINWTGEAFNTRGIHIAIDGKGLRAAARKIRDEKTPYILNAADAASRLVIGPPLYSKCRKGKTGAHHAGGLHYVPDETFGEDKSTIKLGKNTMSILRKYAYNIARLFQMRLFGWRY